MFIKKTIMKERKEEKKIEQKQASIMSAYRNVVFSQYPSSVVIIAKEKKERKREPQGRLLTKT